MTPNELFEQHRALAYKIVGLVKRRFPSLETDEVNQGALLGLWKASLGFKPERDIDFKTFAWPHIWGGAYQSGIQATFFGRYWLRAFAKAGREKPVLVREVNEGENSFFQDEDDSQEVIDAVDQLRVLLDRMSCPKQRETVEMRLQGLKLREIASRLGITKQAVSLREQKGLAELRVLAARMEQ